MDRDRKVELISYGIPLILYISTLLSNWLYHNGLTSIPQIRVWQILCTITLFGVYPVFMILAKRGHTAADYWKYRGTLRLSVLFTLLSYAAVRITQLLWHYYTG